MSTFSVHTSSGATVALVDHFEEALTVLRRDESADKVIRVSDGEVLASKTRFGKSKPTPTPVMS